MTADDLEIRLPHGQRNLLDLTRQSSRSKTHSGESGARPKCGEHGIMPSCQVRDLVVSRLNETAYKAHLLVVELHTAPAGAGMGLRSFCTFWLGPDYNTGTKGEVIGRNAAGTITCVLRVLPSECSRGDEVRFLDDCFAANAAWVPGQPSVEPPSADLACVAR